MTDHHQERHRIRGRTIAAVNRGQLTRPTVCSECGGNLGGIQAHHHCGYDIEHALRVVWLCKPCHYKAHGWKPKKPWPKPKCKKPRR